MSWVCQAGLSWMAVAADLVGSSILVAVTVTSGGPTMAEGAVYTPLLNEPIWGLTDHTTLEVGAPVTVALRTSPSLGPRVATAGVRVTSVRRGTISIALIFGLLTTGVSSIRIWPVP